MVIDARESQILERSRAQRLEQLLLCLDGIELAARDLFKKILKLFV